MSPAMVVRINMADINKKTPESNPLPVFYYVVTRSVANSSDAAR
jgi:hypothetical protein